MSTPSDPDAKEVGIIGYDPHETRYPSMSDAPTLSKEELQVNWRAWVIANLGQDPDRVTVAANAAGGEFYCP